MAPSPHPVAAGKRGHLVPVSLVTSLFFCWGLSTNLLPVLVPKLKAACQLDAMQSMFVDAAYWTAYFLTAVPTAMLMRRFGYRTGIIAGLLIAAAGCFLFVPSAREAHFPMFLAAFFICACGMVFLETAANPYITVLGDPAGATRRLNLAQSFNGLAAVVAALWLSKIIIRPDTLTEAQFGALDAASQKKHLLEQAATVIPPYVAIGAALAALAVVFLFVRLPEIREDEATVSGKFRPFAHPLLVWGVVAQFFYVGAQVGVDATFLNYTHQVTGLSMSDATTYLGLILGCFFIGRVTGTGLMSKIKPTVLLAVYAGTGCVLLALCAMVEADPNAARSAVGIPAWLGLGDSLIFTAHPAPYLLMGVKFCMSIMYPTIFSSAIRGLGHHTKTGASYLVMAIVGGALVPLLVGKIADLTGTPATATAKAVANYRPGYFALALCLVPVFAFALIAHAHDRRAKITNPGFEAA